MRRALVRGAGGFIGGHWVKKLKREGYWVRGVDIERQEFEPQITQMPQNEREKSVKSVTSVQSVVRVCPLSARRRSVGQVASGHRVRSRTGTEVLVRGLGTGRPR
jgi:nucleoside-diphosphate-sugar epimerase